MPSENAINCDVEIYEYNRADNFEKTDDTRSERKRVSEVYWQILSYPVILETSSPPLRLNAFFTERWFYILQQHWAAVLVVVVHTVFKGTLGNIKWNDISTRLKVIYRKFLRIVSNSNK